MAIFDHPYSSPGLQWLITELCTIPGITSHKAHIGHILFINDVYHGNLHDAANGQVELYRDGKIGSCEWIYDLADPNIITQIYRQLTATFDPDKKPSELYRLCLQTPKENWYPPLSTI